MLKRARQWWAEKARGVQTDWGLAGLLFIGGMTTYGLIIPPMVIWAAEKVQPGAGDPVKRLVLAAAGFGCAWAAMAMSTKRTD